MSNLTRGNVIVLVMGLLGAGGLAAVVATSGKFTTIELGGSSVTDTTLARSGAGDVTIEGNAVYRAGGTDVPVADGGTGASTAAAGFDALAPTTTRGDIIFRNATTNTRLAKGAAATVLTMGADDPEWAVPSTGISSDADGNTAAGTNSTNSITAGQGLRNSGYGYDSLTAVTTGDGNTAVGHSAGMSISTNGGGTFVGDAAGKLVTGTANTIIGGACGNTITTGVRNTLVGYGASQAAGATALTDCVHIGQAAGFNNTADQNVFIGSNSGQQSASATGQCFVGYNSGTLATGADNTIFGNAAGDSFTTGTNNTLIGRNAGGAAAATSMANVTMVGKDAGLLNTANENTFIGSLAGDANTSGTGQCFVGYNAGTAVTGSDNTIVGNAAGDAFTTGARNCLFGTNSGGAAGATSMSDCAFFGKDSGLVNTANENCFFGSGSGASNTSGTEQAFFGFNAGNVTTGQSNTFLGYKSGGLAGSTVTTGTFNVLIGANSGSSSVSRASAIAIGYSAEAQADASIAMGRSSSCSTANGFVAGSSSFPINSIFFGKGIIDATPTAYTINGTGGSGTNIAGAMLQLAGGKPTGNAAATDVALLYGLQNTSSASTLRSLSTQTYKLGGTLLTQYTQVTVTASVVNTTETSFLTGTTKGSTSLEGGVLAAGRILRVKAKGKYTSSATPTTAVFKFKHGSTSAWATAAMTPPASMTDAPWEVEIDVIPDAFGSSVNLNGYGIFNMLDETLVTFKSYDGQTTAATFNISATGTLDFTITYNTNTAGNSFTVGSFSIEVVN